MQALISIHYSKNYKRLLMIAKYNKALTVQDAEDVVQETYTRALKYSDTFDVVKSEGILGSRKEAIDRWIGRIFINSLNDQVRDSLNAGVNKEFDEGYSPLSEDWEDIKVKEEVGDKIRKAINSKPDNIKNVLWLRYILGYDPADIRKLSDQSHTNIKAILYRFKKEMAGALGGRYEVISI